MYNKTIDRPTQHAVNWPNASEVETDPNKIAANRMLALVKGSLDTAAFPFLPSGSSSKSRPGDPEFDFYPLPTSFPPTPQPSKPVDPSGGITAWGKRLADHFVGLVKTGRMTVENAAARMMDALHKRVGLKSAMADSVRTMQGEVKSLGTQLMDNLKGLGASTFDTLWNAQNPPLNRRLSADDVKPGGRADTSVALIEQFRIAGKIPDVVEGLDLTGNVRVSIPVATANTASTGFIGKGKVLKLNITGEWGVGKSDNPIGLSGGREVNFSVSVHEDGRVRLDAVTVNEILDVSVAKVAASIMQRFQTGSAAIYPASSDEIEMLRMGGAEAALAGLPDAAEVNADGEMPYDDPSWDNSLIADQFHLSGPAMRGLGELLGFDGQRFPGASPIKAAQAAMSVSWVNKDLGDPDAEFKAGWRHDGLAPDSMGVAVKYSSGAKMQIGPNELNAQGRVFGMAAAGVGYAFTEAGTRTFGRAVGEWGA